MPLLDKLRLLTNTCNALNEMKRALHAEIEAAGVRWEEVALIDRMLAIRLYIIRAGKLEEDDDEEPLQHGPGIISAAVVVDAFIQERQ